MTVVDDLGTGIKFKTVKERDAYVKRELENRAALMRRYAAEAEDRRIGHVGLAARRRAERRIYESEWRRLERDPLVAGELAAWDRTNAAAEDHVAFVDIVDAQRRAAEVDALLTAAGWIDESGRNRLED